MVALMMMLGLKLGCAVASAACAVAALRTSSQPLLHTHLSSHSPHINPTSYSHSAPPRSCHSLSLFFSLVSQVRDLRQWYITFGKRAIREGLPLHEIVSVAFVRATAAAAVTARKDASVHDKKRGVVDLIASGLGASAGAGSGLGASGTLGSSGLLAGTGAGGAASGSGAAGSGGEPFPPGPLVLPNGMLEFQVRHNSLCVCVRACMHACRRACTGTLHACCRSRGCTRPACCAWLFPFDTSCNSVPVRARQLRC